MPRTFKDILASDAEEVFLNTNDFAETVRHYIDGNVAGNDYEDIPAIVHQEDEPRDAQGTAEAMQIDSRQGREVKRFARLELSLDIAVTESSSTTPSRFRLADGRYCTALRILGRDGGLQTVLCSLIDRESTRKAKPS